MMPDSIKPRLLSFIFGRVVKFFGTAGLRFELLTPERSIVFLANRKKVQNHIGGIHAVAMGLICESATGAIVGLNLPGDATPVIKSMQIDYLKRASGAMRAEAWLTAEQIELMQNSDKGEVEVACTVTDEDGKAPITVSMVWAWVPARRPKP
jgi:acyl-coenzyme A thioesterase PaaI-like protein